MNRQRARGFTLVELLIALVLIAIITVLLFGGLRLGTRTWETVERVSSEVAEVRIARNLIEGLLRQAQPATVLVENVELPVFGGDAERIEWVAPLSEQVGIPGLYILRLTLEDAGDRTQLILTRWLLHPEVLAGGDDFPAWEPLLEQTGTAGDAGSLDQDLADGAYGRTLLLPDVERFAIAYFSTDAGFGLGLAADQSPDAQLGGLDGEWVEEWPDPSLLPSRVRIDLTTPARSWPATIVTLPGPRG